MRAPHLELLAHLRAAGSAGPADRPARLGRLPGSRKASCSSRCAPRSPTSSSPRRASSPTATSRAARCTRAASRRTGTARTSWRPSGKPVGAVVLLHGLTDSPYSLRHVARRYVQAGYVAVAIRLPGHGTVPAGLSDVEWEQWMAATRLAVREARRLAPAPAPLHLVGLLQRRRAGDEVRARRARRQVAGAGPTASCCSRR